MSEWMSDSTMGLNYLDVETAMEYVSDTEDAGYLFQGTYRQSSDIIDA